MNKIWTLLTIFTLCITYSYGQTLEELEAQKSELEAQKAGLQEQFDTYNGYQAEINAINDQILKLSGWQTGFSGLIGFSFTKSNNWVSNPNPNASSSALNLGFTGYANKITDSYFWRNKGILNKSWSDVDLSDADAMSEDDGLFDNGTVDLLNLNSLYGKTLSDKIAASAMGEVNTSLGNFLDPGTLDIGVGITYTPNSDLVVVIHPLNYHVAFSGLEGVESTGALGAKLRADYTKNFAGGVAWSSTLTSFIPYVSKDPTLFEYSWINTLSFEVWNGLGVGFSLGIRKAEFEWADTQTYYSLGLSYALGQ